MINLDKIKNAIGTQLFDYIGSLNKSELEKMLSDINKDIVWLINSAQQSTKTEYLPLRQLEKTLIEYRLEA